MKTKTRSISAARILAGSIAALLAAQSAHADNTWDGGAGGAFNWSDNVNWGGDTAPGYGALVFGGAVGTTNTLDASYSMNQVNWNGTSAWTLDASGGSVLSLFDNGGTQAKLENFGTGLVTINAPVTFAATAGSNWGEINAVSGDMTFGAGTLTVNGSGVNGIRLFGAGRTTTFNNTVSAAGKYFSTSAVGTTVGIGGAFTASDLYIMNDGVLNLNSGSSVTANVRLGGDFATTGTQDLTKSGALNLTPAAGGLTFAGVVNSVASNTSGTLAVNSQNTSGTNTLSGQFFLDSALRITQAAGGTLALTNATGPDLKGNTLTLTPASGASISISGAITNSVGSGSLTHAGAGTTTLSGANTYTGATTVSAGTLISNNITNWKSSVAIASGATFNWNITGGQQAGNSAGNYTISGTGLAVLSGGSLINFSQATPVIQFNMSAGGQMDVQGTNTIVEFGYGHNSMGGNLGSLNVGAGARYQNSDASAVVDALTGSGVVSNAYNTTFVLTVGASNTVNNAAYGVSGNTANFSGVLKDVGGINGQATGPTALTKTGTGKQILSGTNTYTGVTTVNGGVLQIGNAGTSGTLGAGNVTLTSPGNLNFNRTDAAYSYGGVISGSGSLTQAGAGTTTLTGNNSYTGATTVSAGKLSVVATYNANWKSSVDIAAGATFNWNVTGARGIANTAGNYNITGAGLFAVSGTGTQVFSNASPVVHIYMSAGGQIDVQNTSTLELGYGDNGMGGNLGSLNVNTGARYYNSDASAVVDALTGGGAIGNAYKDNIFVLTVGASNTVNNAAYGVSSNTATFSGAIKDNEGYNGQVAGAGTLTALTKTGTGTQIFSGASTYTGVTTLTGGILSVATIGNGGVSGNLGKATNAAAKLVFNGGTLQYTGATASTDRNFTINAGKAATFDITANNLTVSGATTATNGALTKTGNGTLTLSGTNLHTGATTITAGALQFAKIASLYNSGTGSWTAANIKVANGATLALNVGGTGEFSTGNVTTVLTNLGGLGGAPGSGLGLQAGSKIAFDTTNASGSTFTVADNLADSTGTGGGAIGVTKLGTNTLVLSGTNTHTGATTLTSGTLSVGTIGNGGVSGNLGAATNAAANLVFNGGTLQYTGATASTDRSFTINTGKTATFDITANNLTVSGASTATNGALTKTGAGTLTFSGANTYTGATTVSVGALTLASTASLANTAITIGNGATLSVQAGSGNVAAAGTLTLNSGSLFTMSGDNGLGTFTLGGAGTGLTLNGLTVPILTFDIGNAATGTDRIIVTNNVSILTGGIISITQLTGLTSLTAGNYDLITSAGGFSGSGGNGFTLNSNTITVAGALYNLSLANSTSSIQKLTVSLSAGQSAYWAGAVDGNWNTAAGANWRTTVAGNGSSGVSPSSTTNVFFATTTPVAGNLTTSLGADTTINSLTFTGDATSPVSIGGNTLTLNAGTGDGISVSAGSAAHTISSNVALGASQNWTLNNAPADALTVSGVVSDGGSGYALTKVGAGTLALSGANTYTGVTTITAGTLSVATIGNGGVSGNLGAATNAAANLVFNGGTLQYTGATASTDRSFTINTGKTATFDITANNLTISGASTGTNGGLTKIGAGTLTLTGANNYTGATTVTAGVLSSSNLNAWKSNVSIAAGATFNWNVTGNQQVADTAGDYTVSGTGLLTLSGGALLNFGNATPVVRFNMSAGGQIDVQGTNTIAEFGYAHNAMGGNLGSLNVGAGAKYYNSDVAASVDALTGGGRINNAYNANVFTLTIGASNTTNNAAYGVAGNTADFSGVIAGPETYNTVTTAATAVVKTGTGTQIFSGANTYLGSTTISGGTLSVATIGDGGVSGNLGAATNAAANLVFDGGTLQYTGATASTDRNFTINTGKTANFDITANNLIVSGASTATNGALTKTGNGTLTLSGANTYTGVTTVNGGVLQIGNAGSSGTLGTGNVTLTSPGNLTFNRTDTAYSYGGVISGGGSLTQGGTGTTTLTGANTFTGATTVSAGMLSVASSSNWKSSVAIASGATFNWSVASNQQVADTAGNYTFSGDGIFTLSGGARQQFSNGNPIVRLNMAAGGQIDVQGSGSILEFGYAHNAMGGNLGSLNVGAGASYRNSDVSAVVDALTGSGVVGNAYSVNTFSLTVGVSNTLDSAAYGVSSNTATFSGVIKNVDGYNGQSTGPTSLIKSGTGTQILSGVNTYTGATTVNGGTLRVTGSISGSAVTVNSSGILGGSGTTGAVTVVTGGTIAPGSSIGTLNTGNLTFTGGTFGLEIDTTAVTTDLANVTGNLNLLGGATLSLSDFNVSGTPLTGGQVFTFLDYSGAWDGGTFAGYADDSQFTLGLNDYIISYNGTDGATSAVTLEVVPEPGSAILLLGGLGTMLGLRRRRA